MIDILDRLMDWPIYCQDPEVAVELMRDAAEEISKLRVLVHYHETMDQFKGFLPRPALPAFLGAAGFMVNDGIERVLPRSG